MAEISFRQVDLGGSTSSAGRVFELVSKELGGPQSPEEIARLIDYRNGAVILGGFVGDEMVCMNAFMPMYFSNGADRFVGYQSGFSATSSDHRGRGYWPRLLVASEEMLAAMGGAFIFGYPNAVSHPLFVKKLAYTTLPTDKVRLALVPGLFETAFKGSIVRRIDGTLRPDVDGHIAWKRRSSDDRIFVSEDRDEVVWGKVRQIRRAGLGLRFLEIGSMDLPSGSNVKRSIAHACRNAGVRLCYLTVNRDNELAPLFRSQGEGQPLIVKGIGGFDATTARINFFGGLMDTY